MSGYQKEIGKNAYFPWVKVPNEGAGLSAGQYEGNTVFNLRPII
jgi:hypothetical protein